MKEQKHQITKVKYLKNFYIFLNDLSDTYFLFLKKEIDDLLKDFITINKIKIQNSSEFIEKIIELNNVKKDLFIIDINYLKKTIDPNINIEMFLFYIRKHYKYFDNLVIKIFKKAKIDILYNYLNSKFKDKILFKDKLNNILNINIKNNQINDNFEYNKKLFDMINKKVYKNNKIIDFYNNMNKKNLNFNSFNENYFNFINCFPLLSRFEEKILFFFFKHKTNDSLKKKAKNILILTNLRLVISLSKRFINRGIGFFDLLQAGILGLNKGLEKFKTGKNTKCSTYVLLWIVQCLSRSISEKSRLIRIPVHVIDIKNKCFKFIKEYYVKYDKHPTIQILIEKFNLTKKQFRYIFSLDSDCFHLDKNIINLNGKILNDIIEDKKDKFIRNKNTYLYSQNDKSKILKDIANQLPDRMKEIINLRYGLLDGKTCTLDVIGKRLSLTRERVRQIEKNAIKKIKIIIKQKGLKDLLLNNN